jgi:hypothetical protein
MTFVFWGLFVALGLIALGYYAWMLWVERDESHGSHGSSRGSSRCGGAPDRTEAP